MLECNVHFLCWIKPLWKVIIFFTASDGILQYRKWKIPITSLISIGLFLQCSRGNQQRWFQVAISQYLSLLLWSLAVGRGHSGISASSSTLDQNYVIYMFSFLLTSVLFAEMYCPANSKRS